MQHFVVKAQHVEPHDEIGALKFGEQVVDLFLAVDAILALRGVIGHADAESHLVQLVAVLQVHVDLLEHVAVVLCSGYVQRGDQIPHAQG